ncbi:MAG: hypothetical protein QXW56_03320 [Nitrososphaerota archaeon]
MRCQFCGSPAGFPIGATGYGICPRCMQAIYEPLTDLYQVMRTHGLLRTEQQEQARRRGRRPAEERVEERAAEAPAEEQAVTEAEA